jgi:hypothetical protein
MTYTINGKEYTDFDINVRCAELQGLVVQTIFKKNLGFTKSFHEDYPSVIWCAEVDKYGQQMHAWEQKVFTACPEDAWRIIVICWDELMLSVNDGGYSMGNLESVYNLFGTKWDYLIEKHNCTKLVAACICLIEINDGGAK